MTHLHLPSSTTRQPDPHSMPRTPKAKKSNNEFIPRIARGFYLREIHVVVVNRLGRNLLACSAIILSTAAEEGHPRIDLTSHDSNFATVHCRYVEEQKDLNLQPSSRNPSGSLRRTLSILKSRPDKNINTRVITIFMVSRLVEN
jgi:hypothetical protein